MAGKMPRRPLILFFNRFFDTLPDTASLPCSDLCEFSEEIDRLPEAAAVIFHVPTLRGMRRVVKYPRQLWVAWSLESNVNYPQFSDPTFMRHFDLTMTYERNSDVWTSYLPSSAIFAAALRTPPKPKLESAPAVLFQSAAVDRSGRGAYCRELMRHLQIDSYGRILNNRRIDVPDRGHETKLATIAGYKFTLAFENSIAPDYVTEKFFDPLLAGSVPVYLGAPNVEDFAPGDDCFVDVTRFSEPAALAAHLSRLASDPAAYRRLLAWRDRPLRPAFVAAQRLDEIGRAHV